MNTTIRTSRTIAIEDLEVGDYITVIRAVGQCLPDALTDNFDHQTHVLRFSYIPCDAGWPQRVRSICAPFVFTQTANGRHNVVDTRAATIAKVKKSFGRQVFKDLARARKKQ